VVLNKKFPGIRFSVRQNRLLVLEASNYSGFQGLGSKELDQRINAYRGSEAHMQVTVMNTRADKLRNYTIIARLDDAIPLNTEEWVTVERLLNQISEFVPISMLNNVTEAIISYADDQARRGYLLGQEDLVKELKNKAQRIA